MHSMVLIVLRGQALAISTEHVANKVTMSFHKLTNSQDDTQSPHDALQNFTSNTLIKVLTKHLFYNIPSKWTNNLETKLFSGLVK